MNPRALEAAIKGTPIPDHLETTALKVEADLAAMAKPAAPSELEENTAKYIAGETPHPRERKYTGKGKGPPPSGTDPPPSRAQVAKRFQEYTETHGPKAMIQTHLNRKVPR